MKENQVIQGDCLEIMRGMPSSCIDLICTDPPYYKVKAESWDRQWGTDTGYLLWLKDVALEWHRILKPNGSLYCFASPRLSAKVEILIGEIFDVLNCIRWNKTNLAGGGRHRSASKEMARLFFPAQESIIFAEQKGADSAAKGEAGYLAQCDKLKGFVFEPIRAYLDGERQRAGASPSQISKWFADRGFPKYVVARHAFSRNQWELPTKVNYGRLRDCFSDLARGGEYLRRDYEDLRRDYEDLRRDYEDLRRYFAVSKDVPYTDTWEFSTVFPYKGKHVCEKPLELLSHIIQSSSRPGDLVLDCFSGSGSTAIACKQLGRRFIAIEKDPAWVSRSIDRIRCAHPVEEVRERQGFGRLEVVSPQLVLPLFA